MSHLLRYVFLFISISLFAHTDTSQQWSIEKPTVDTIQGLGVEFDPHFIAQNVSADVGARRIDWDSIVIRRLRLLGFSKLRVMVLPYWYEKQNDNDNPTIFNPSGFDFNTPEMENVCLLLDEAEKEGLQVTLTFWGASPKTFLLSSECNMWMAMPSEYEEWAENISQCLRYLLLDKKYKCISEITPVNEPDWSFCPGEKSHTDQYTEMCKVLDKRLKSDGLRHLVHFSLSDNSDGGTGTHKFLLHSTQTLSHQADIFNSHTYIFGYKTPNSKMLSWERENVRLCHNVGKQHFVGEFGSNENVGATIQRDIDRYDRGILMARIVINILNAGVTGLSYWNLLDQYYSRSEAQSHGNMQKLGLWHYLKKEYEKDSIFSHLLRDYQVRPQYYSLGLLAQAIRPGGRIFPINTQSEWIAATAVQDNKEKWKYVVANPLDSMYKISLQILSSLRNRYDVSYYTETSLPQDDRMIKPTVTIRNRRDRLLFQLPARCVMVISEK